MFFKSKVFIYLLIGCPTFLFGKNIFAQRSGYVQLNSYTGTSLALSGLGAASNGDQSMVDINPAIMSAFEKQYTAFANLNFYAGLSMIEAGVLDTNNEELGGVLKVRQTTGRTTEKDRKYTLGFSTKLPNVPLSIGILGNYDQFEVSGFKNSADTNYSGGIGVLGQLSEDPQAPIYIGASIIKLFDKYENKIYNLAISHTMAEGLVSVHADASSDLKSDRRSFGGGVDVRARTFFYVKVSAGRDFAQNRNFVGGGLFFDGPNLKAFYALAKNHTVDKVLEHSLGLSIAF